MVGKDVVEVVGMVGLNERADRQKLSMDSQPRNWVLESCAGEEISRSGPSRERETGAHCFRGRECIFLCSDRLDGLSADRYILEQYPPPDDRPFRRKVR